MILRWIVIAILLVSSTYLNRTGGQTRPKNGFYSSKGHVERAAIFLHSSSIEFLLILLVPRRNDSSSDRCQNLINIIEVFQASQRTIVTQVFRWKMDFARRRSHVERAIIFLDIIFIS